MIRYFTLLLFTAVCMQTASAQVTTKYGDNVSTLDGIIKAYYDVVTVKKGEKLSFERDSLLHIAGARVGSVAMDKQGKKYFDYMTLREFHNKFEDYLTKNGFYEQEISRKVRKFGSIYHVWSTYESRATATSPVVDRGINSIELFNDGKRFWILGWFYDDERKDNPIPAEYLN